MCLVSDANYRLLDFFITYRTYYLVKKSSIMDRFNLVIEIKIYKRV